MGDSAWTRRLVTVPALYLTLAGVTILSPVLLPVAAAIDLVRWVALRRPWMSMRVLAFLWVYLAAEAAAIPALAAVGPLPRPLRLELTYRLQQAWVNWNFAAVGRIFSLTFDAEGTESIAPGPIIVLSRHASLIDTLLPAVYVTEGSGIRLRYVLKRELLADPALDIAGGRLPNHFVDRAGASSRRLQELGQDLGPGEGVLIYPEGTRFSEAKRERYRSGSGPLSRWASRLRRVLPPRPGGTLALLEATAADIVVLAHKGLEGFARVKDIWGGGLVGSTIEVRFWRVPRSQIPAERSARVDWLFGVWSDIDDWVCAELPAGAS